MVPIQGRAGEQVGSVTLPDGTSGALVISGGEEVVIIDAVVSMIVDVTLVSDSGEEITDFDDPIEICFETDEDEGDVCLGFFNDDQKWECEDYCLDAKDGSLCGETEHLTNFALLLSNVDSSDRCGSGSTNYVILYLSIALVVVAILSVVVVAVTFEVRVRWNSLVLENTFRDLERNTGGLTTD